VDLNLRRTLRALRHWWWLLVLGPAIAGSIGYMLARREPALYSSSTRIIVGRSLQSVNADYGTLYASERLAKTYIELATSYSVLEGVVKDLNLGVPPESLAGQISAFPIEETEFLDIVVVDDSPQGAADIANAVARELVLQSPAGPQSAEALILQDVQAQILDLQTKIKDGKVELERLQAQIDLVPVTDSNLRTLTESEEKRFNILLDERDLLHNRIASYQDTLSRLYETFLGNQSNTLTVVEPARPQAAPIAPRPSRSAIMTGLVGLVIALGLALILGYLDNTIKSSKDLSDAIAAPLLSTIPRIDGIKADPDRLITRRAPLSAAAESYRALRTNLQFSSIDQAVSLLAITSPGPGEGKTTVAANLAVAMAQADIRVILVDADLRKPMHHRIFELDNTIGLTTMLADRDNDPEHRLEITEVMPNLRVIPSGPIPPNPAELLSSKRMEFLLWLLQQEADLVIVDTPPVLNVADALAVAPRCNGVLIVAESGKTRIDALSKVYQSLVRVGARVLGVALNKANERGGDYYYYSSYYTTEEEPITRRSKRAARKAKRSGQEAYVPDQIKG
jgi:capsular exopolysaccharide synthesis family protein